MNALARRRAPETTRAEILDKAVEVASEGGTSGFTLDAVAARTSFSKGAVLHHFPTKTALLEGMVDHLGQMFTEAILTEAARDPEPYGRNARAYLRVTINDTVTPQDVNVGKIILAACAIEPSLAARWTGWVREVTKDDPCDSAGADDALLLRLLADGIWMSDLFGVHEISPEQRKTMLSLLTPGHPAMLEPAA